MTKTGDGYAYHQPFQDSDSRMMLEIERLCPQGDESYAVGAKKTDFVARYRMYDNWKVMVAEEEGQLIGWIGWTVKNTMGGPSRGSRSPQFL